MLGICLKNVIYASKTFTSAVTRIENRMLHTLFRSQDENVSLHKSPSACSGSGQSLTCQCRDLHITTVAPGKYHNLIRRRTKVKKKMAFLSSRLERLDQEDRPTGCILCPMRGDIEIDYKNVRLLSQFVSPHTGRIYGKALTGLCRKKQNEIAKAIRRARTLGYMPVTMKYFEFHNDPAIF